MVKKFLLKLMQISGGRGCAPHISGISGLALLDILYNVSFECSSAKVFEKYCGRW